MQSGISSSQTDTNLIGPLQKNKSCRGRVSGGLAEHTGTPS